MLRSVLAVVGGYLTLLVGVMAFFAPLMVFSGAMSLEDAGKPFDGPVWILWAELVVSLLVAVVGGYVCAWIAGRAEVPHAAALAGVMWLLGGISVATEWGMKPLWSSVAVALVPPAFAILGGVLRARIRPD